MSRLMGMIRVAKAQRGMDEDTYRDFLKNTLGKRSLAGSTGSVTRITSGAISMPETTTTASGFCT